MLSLIKSLFAKKEKPVLVNVPDPEPVIVKKQTKIVKNKKRIRK